MGRVAGVEGWRGGQSGQVGHEGHSCTVGPGGLVAVLRAEPEDYGRAKGGVRRVNVVPAWGGHGVNCQ